MHTVQFQIQELRSENQLKMLESMLAILFSLFISAFGPSLLLQFVYTDQFMTEAPLVLQYLPVATFAFGVGYVVYAVLGNMGRRQQIQQLQQQLALTSDMTDMDDDAELKELEALVDEALEKHSTAKKTSKKKTKTARKSKSRTRKSSKKSK